MGPAYYVAVYVRGRHCGGWLSVEEGSLRPDCIGLKPKDRKPSAAPTGGMHAFVGAAVGCDLGA
jgi:hypothetical protein